MKTVLFVCTGNTCRSPLAEGLLRLEAERRDLDFVVSSAGTFAVRGAPASPQSIAAGRRREVDLSGHEARPLSQAIVDAADLVLAMSPVHLTHLAAEFGRESGSALVTAYLPSHHERYAAPVEDPYGGGEADYERVARLLAECVECVLDRLAGA